MTTTIGLTLAAFLVVFVTALAVPPVIRRLRVRRERLIKQLIAAERAAQPIAQPEMIDREQAWRNMHEPTRQLPIVGGGLYTHPHELDDGLSMRMWDVLANKPELTTDDIP